MKREELLLPVKQVKEGLTSLPAILRQLPKEAVQKQSRAKKIKEIQGAQKINLANIRQPIPLFYTDPIFFAKENDPL